MAGGKAQAFIPDSAVILRYHGPVQVPFHRETTAKQRPKLTDRGQAPSTAQGRTITNSVVPIHWSCARWILPAQIAVGIVLSFCTGAICHRQIANPVAVTTDGTRVPVQFAAIIS